MKFVCRECEAFMTLSEQEKVADGSLGITFACPKCGHRFSMVTNPGETQMVYSLGVKVGGRDKPAEPMEMTRGTLAGAVRMETGAAETASGGSCPFSEMVVQQEKAPAPAVEAPAWTTEAELRLERIPRFVRPMIQKEIERIAKSRGLTLITEDLMQEIRDQMGGMPGR